jgi:NitT/TauT family transport system substrate-binding protein
MGGVVILAIAALAIVTAWQPWSRVSARESIRILTIPYLTFAPIFIALEEGFFAEQGLDIELQSASRSDATIPLLVQGEIDVVPAAIMPSFFNIISQGAPIRVVAGKGLHAGGACPYNGIMVRRSLLESGEVHTVEDIRGRPVSVDRSAPFYFGFNLWLKRGNLGLKDVTVMDLPPPARLQAFRAGTIDMAYATEPWITRMLRDGASELWIDASELMPDYQYGYVLFGKRLLLERPELGEKFMVAYLRAVRQLNSEGPSRRHIEILAKHTGLDQDLLKEVCWPAIRDRRRPRATGKPEHISGMGLRRGSYQRGNAQRPDI